MIETKTTEIGDRRFTVTQMPARRGFQIYTRLARALAPALAQVAASGGKITRMDMGQIGSALTALLAGLPEKDVDEMAAALLANAQVEYTDQRGERRNSPLKPELVDALFAGKMHDYMKLLLFAVEVNFGEVFGAARGLFEKVAGEAQLSPDSNT